MAPKAPRISLGASGFGSQVSWWGMPPVLNKRMMDLARALAVQAAVLLMDEPIANVDAPNVVQWLSMVQGMTAQGQTVVSVLHDLNLALRADRVVVMHEGQVLIQAPAHDPALHTCLQQVFEHALTFHFWQDRWIALPR